VKTRVFESLLPLRFLSVFLVAPLGTTNTGRFVRIIVAQVGGVVQCGWYVVAAWLGVMDHALNLCFLQDDGDDAQLHHEKHTI